MTHKLCLVTNKSKNKLTNLLKFPGDIIEDDLEEYITGKCFSYEIKEITIFYFYRFCVGVFA